MGFLRRLLGGDARSDAREATLFQVPEIDAEIDAEERQYELDLLRSEQERLDDLAQRQLRYARYAWEPPAQGDGRRADERDGPATGHDEVDPG